MMEDHSVHLLVFAVPLGIVALFWFRGLMPVLALVLLLHHHLDPLPGSASATPPPVCCTLAQSTEPTDTEVETRLVLTVRIRPLALPVSSGGPWASAPAIRAPPVAIVPPPLAS